jgi:hypothetical protein
LKPDKEDLEIEYTIEENGKLYDLSKDEDIKKYINREFEVKEKMYDLNDD